MDKRKSWFFKTFEKHAFLCNLSATEQVTPSGGKILAIIILKPACTAMKHVIMHTCKKIQEICKI